METLYTEDPLEAQKKGKDESCKRILEWGAVITSGQRWVTMLILATILSAILVLSYTAYISFGVNFGTFAEAIHFAILGSDALINSVCYLHNKKLLTEVIFGLVGNGFYNYGQTFDSNTFKNLVENKRLAIKVEKQKLSVQFTKLICITAVVNSIARPLIDYFTGRLAENISKTIESPDGIVWLLPVVIWFPFKSDSILHVVGGIIYEYLATIAIVGGIICLDVPLIVFGEELCNEFEVLGQSLMLFDERAKALYKIRHSREPDVRNGEKDFRLETCIKDCFRDSVKHHQILIKYFYALRHLQYASLIVSVFAATFVLCLSGVLFTDTSLSLSVKINFTIIIISELVYSFIFCYYGQRIQDASIIPINAVYNGEWYQYSDTIRYYSLVIQACSHPLKLNAGGFINVSLDTFTDICRSAYSYFSLLQIMKE